MEEVISNRLQNDEKSIFNIVPAEYKINIEFSNLTYEVPDRKQGFKSILRNINGEFRPNELTAIMGTSGSGKTTLINLLAGYRNNATTGIINVNKRPRNVKLFRKISRFILQQDHISPHFTVMESMMFAAKLKLNAQFAEQQHIDEINKILDILHLRRQANTRVSNISGGERKRLCIALELLNIPTVLFLDEPTTGLDEFSATQCIKILKNLVASGRTIICSIHSPSARLLQMFDQVYVMADGQCVYQGATENILPYLTNIGFNCPHTYNPADFMIEVAGREYGDYHDELVNEVKNGKIYKWRPAIEVEKNPIEHFSPKVINDFDLEANSNLLLRNNPWLTEFKILYVQMLKQMWRDNAYIKLKVFIKVFTILFVSVVYIGIGTDGTMFVYNYHLAFITSITFIFLSMCPMLSHIPLEMNYLRREYYNQWYRLSSYFMALITTQIPDIFVLSAVCSAMLYFITDQPPELYRYLLFLFVIILTSMTASSFGLSLSSRLNLLNSLFLGPCLISCWVIFANHSVGNPELSSLEKILMYSGYIRHSVEGLLSALLGFNRASAICPSTEIFCYVKNPSFLLKLMGYEKLSYIYSIVCLIGFYLLFNIVAYINFNCRLGSFKFFDNNRYYRYLKKCIWRYIYLKLY